MTFDQMVRTAAAAAASDIHLRAGHAPLVRINGSLQRWASVAAVSAADMEAIGEVRSAPIIAVANAESIRTRAGDHEAQ